MQAEGRHEDTAADGESVGENRYCEAWVATEADVTKQGTMLERRREPNMSNRGVWKGT